MNMKEERKVNDQELRLTALRMAIESSIAQNSNGDAKAMFNDILMRRVDAFYRFLSDTAEVTFDDRDTGRVR